MVLARRFAVIVLANRSGSLLNKTAEKAMELILPLEAKAGDQAEQSMAINKAELSDYVGTFANKPERRQAPHQRRGKLVLKREDGEFR